MGAVPEKTSDPTRKSSGNKSIFMIIGILGAIFAIGLAYMVVFVSPEEVVERVKIIAVTEKGCIGETFDGYAVNIGDCKAQPGDTIMAPVDQKLKERAYAMNPTD